MKARGVHDLHEKAKIPVGVLRSSGWRLANRTYLRNTPWIPCSWHGTCGASGGSHQRAMVARLLGPE